MADEHTINIKITADASDVDKKISGIGKEIDSVERKNKRTTDEMTTDWGKVGSQMEKVGSNLTKKLTLPLVALGGVAVKLASDLHETVEKSRVVFDTHAGAVEAWADTAIDSFGMAKESALSA